MTAQAIEGAMSSSMNLFQMNETLSDSTNPTVDAILSEKIGIATTLALLVGLVQVNQTFSFSFRFKRHVSFRSLCYLFYVWDF